MVRGILRRSVGQGPAIINFENAAFHGDCDYSTHIRKVSEHYGIHFWTFADIVWSEEINKISDTARQELQYLVTPAGTQTLPLDAHPSWPVHLFWADLMAAALTVEFNRCEALPNGSPLRLRDTFVRDGVLVPKLPLPIYLPAKNNHCRGDLPALIDLNVDVLINEKLKKSSTDGNIGSFRATPVDAWPILEDRAEKFGWISVYNEPTIQHSERIGFFAPSTLPSKLHLSSYNHSVLSIEYLRTYNNAGMFNIYICGEKVKLLDALYDKSFVHLSLPEGFVYIHQMSTSADGLSYCSDSKLPIIEVEHIPVDMTSDQRAADRGNQKVRLMKVKLCIMDEKNFSY